LRRVSTGQGDWQTSYLEKPVFDSVLLVEKVRQLIAPGASRNSPEQSQPPNTVGCCGLPEGPAV
jgi:hypothetical protein